MTNRVLLIAAITFLLIFDSRAQKEEMRGAWVATAKNIDYPSSRFLSSEEQKQEFIALLDTFKNIGINAVFVQIRPAADAFFPSKFEPWSEWLTGQQGKAPDPYYDPLKFMIKECHKRNIQFHAWINPFRAVATITHADIAEDHISNRRPEWIFTYDINKYFDPGIPEVRNYVINIITDIARRYDIDGIHFDDYFYPYPKKDENRQTIPIPDSETYKLYGEGFDNIEDWRRNNMNVFIRSVNDSLKAIKPDLVFGVSPSGIWRNKSRDPKGSDTRGFAHYDYLYADVLTWLREGWIDYVAPQLYWSIGHPYADYKTLVDWWSQNTYGRHLYIGQGIYNANPEAADINWRNPSQLPNQLRINYDTPNVFGSIFYKASSIRQNPLGMNDSLRYRFYAEAAVPPRFSWLADLPIVDDPIIREDTVQEDEVLTVDTKAPPPPKDLTAAKFGNQLVLSWTEPDVSGKHPDDAPDYYKVYRFREGDDLDLNPIHFREIRNDSYYTIKRRRFALFKKRYVYVITSVDEAGNESRVGNEIELKLKLRH